MANVAAECLDILSDPDRCLFVGQLPSYLHLKCPVCLETLLPEPYLFTCCGHHLCVKCVRKLQKMPCPLCKAEDVGGGVHARVPDKGQTRALNSLRVYCPNKERPCEWVGEFSALRSHLVEYCAYVLLKCKFNCGSLVARRNMTVHESEKCSHRPATCQYCETYSTTFVQVKKHELECPKAEITCPHNCDASSFLRENLSQHLQGCSKVPVNCTFAHAGCKWQGPNSTLDCHLEQMWKQHISLITLHTTQQTLKEQNAKISALSAKVGSQEAAINELTKEIEAMKRLQNHKPAVTLPSIPAGKQTLKFKVDRFGHKKAQSHLHHSPLFKFADDKGCSMQLTVYLNGANKAKGSHISVYVGFIGSLPFCGSALLIRLCSQHRFYNHHEEIVTFDAYSSMENVTLPTGLGKRIGMEYFISHSLIKPYLKDDCLLFELPQIIV